MLKATKKVTVSATRWNLKEERPYSSHLGINDAGTLKPPAGDVATPTERMAADISMACDVKRISMGEKLFKGVLHP